MVVAPSPNSHKGPATPLKCTTTVKLDHKDRSEPIKIHVFTLMYIFIRFGALTYAPSRMLSGRLVLAIQCLRSESRRLVSVDPRDLMVAS